MNFYNIASGSSGNSYLIYTENTCVLLDAGVSGKKITDSLQSLGKSVEELDAILITHSHGDHIKSLRIISKKAHRAKIFITESAVREFRDKINNDQIVEILPFGEEFTIGNILVNNFYLSHDAEEATGFSFYGDGRRLTVITDTGVIVPEMEPFITDSDLLILEANYEHNVLMMGDYPYGLKRRIAGELGHLSNEGAGECLVRMFDKREKPEMPIVYLAHLSRENNTPAQALITVRSMLYEKGYHVGEHIELSVFAQGESGPVITV